MRQPSLPSRLLVSVALGSMWLTAPLLSGCSNFQKQPPRYNVVQGEKRSPMLNPGGASYTPPEFEQGTAPGVPQPVPAGMSAGMAAPTGNDYPPAGYEPSMTSMEPPVMPEAAGTPQGRKVPAGNQQALQAESGMVAAADIAPMVPVQSADLTPPPMEANGYQPMVNENGEFPTLADVPQVPKDVRRQAKAARKEAKAFAQDSEALPPIAEASAPAPGAGEAMPNVPVDAALPSLTPEPVAAAAEFAELPPVNQPPSEPATPLMRADENYQEYYAEPAPTMAPQPSADATMAPPPPLPPENDSYAMAPLPPSGTGLPPIQLRAPAMAAEPGIGVGNGRFLPASRYARRARTARQMTLRH